MAEGLDFEKSLTEKVGGLPGFAWVGIGLVGYLLYKKYKGGSSAPTTSTSVTDPGASAPMATNTATDQYGNTVSLPLGTNSSWASTAANQLMSTGSYSATDIQTALSNYLTGNGLTSTQQSIIDSVLHTFGTPPEGVIPVYQPPVDPTQLPQPYVPPTPQPYVPPTPQPYVPPTPQPYVPPTPQPYVPPTTTPSPVGAGSGNARVS